MMIGLAGPKRVIDERLFACHTGARHPLDHDEWLESGLPENIASNLQPLKCGDAIPFIGPIIRIDQGGRKRIGTCETHGTARSGSQESRIQCDAGVAELLYSRFDT